MAILLKFQLFYVLGRSYTDNAIRHEFQGNMAILRKWKFPSISYAKFKFETFSLIVSRIIRLRMKRV